MAESVGVMLGKGAEFQALGKTWKISAPNQDAKDRLEKLAAKVALDEVRRLKDVLDAPAYKEAFAEVTSNLKNYHTWRPGWQAIVFDAANTHLFLWSLLKEAHPDVSEAEVLGIVSSAPEEVAFAYAQVMPAFFTMLLEPIRDRVNPEALAKIEALVAALPEQIRRTPKS